MRRYAASIPVCLIAASLFLGSALDVCPALGAEAKRPDALESLLADLEPPAPFCDTRVELDVAREFFVEVANDLPGVEDYNAIVRAYRRATASVKLDAGSWAEFDEGVRQIRKRFPTTPLQEAVDFIEAQAMFDRIDADEPSNVASAEKALREALVKYPKSTLAPIVSAGAADWFLHHDMPSKALALYEATRQKYPSHPLDCALELGAGEAAFGMRDFTSAESRFQGIIGSCRNDRLRAGAAVRLADSQWLLDKTSRAEASYQKLMDADTPVVDRYYPSALYNMGEIKYRRHEYKPARFYFNEFLRYARKDSDCVANAMKRTADIAYHSRENMDHVSGLYFAVRDAYPENDVGIFSYLHALMLTFPAQEPVERERRIRVFDEQVDKIKDEDLRRTAYLEKGLAALKAGEPRALDYLARLDRRAPFLVEKGEVGDFIRDELLGLLEKQASRPTASDDETLEPIETAFPVWIEGKKQEPLARGLYERVLLARFEAALAGGHAAIALSRLERWEKSRLWPTGKPAATTSRHVAKALLAALYASPSPALTLLKDEKILAPFDSPELSLVWAVTAIQTGDNERAKHFSEAALVAHSPLATPEYWLAEGQLLARAGFVAKADEAFLKVKDQRLVPLAARERFEMQAKAGDVPKAISAAGILFPALSQAERKQSLTRLYSIVLGHALWKQAGALLELAKKSALEKQDLAKFEFLAARGDDELSRSQTAAEHYQAALVLGLGGNEAAEARYRLGRCFVKQQKRAQARKVWEELISTQDTFWAPLARSEMKILSP